MLKKIKGFLNKLSKKEYKKQEFKLKYENFEDFKKAMTNKETFKLK